MIEQTYPHAKSEMERRHAEELETLHLHQGLFEVARKAGRAFGGKVGLSYWEASEQGHPRHWNVSYSHGGGLVQGLMLHLHLGPDDPYGSTVAPAMDEIREALEGWGFEEVKTGEAYESIRAIDWRWEKKDNRRVAIQVRVFTEQNTRCHWVDTGKTEKVFALDCGGA